MRCMRDVTWWLGKKAGSDSGNHIKALEGVDKGMPCDLMFL